jgi:hypothetical protein
VNEIIRQRQAEGQFRNDDQPPTGPRLIAAR